VGRLDGSAASMRLTWRAGVDFEAHNLEIATIAAEPLDQHDAQSADDLRVFMLFDTCRWSGVTGDIANVQPLQLFAIVGFIGSWSEYISQ
jgi:hypothetical protein